MKKFLVVAFFASFALSACGQPTQSNTPANPTPDTTATVQPTTPPPATVNTQSNSLHTDSKTGISFVVPDGWTVGTDEGGNLDLVKGNPYLTVVFKVFDKKNDWQDAMNGIKNGVLGDDFVISNKQITLSGYSATGLVMERRLGTTPGAKPLFRYGEYFVDAKTKFYEVSTAEPDSPDIQQIIQSVKLP